MTFGKVLEAFKSRFPEGGEGKELYLTDKKSGEWSYLLLTEDVGAFREYWPEVVATVGDIPQYGLSKLG